MVAPLANWPVKYPSSTRCIVETGNSAGKFELTVGSSIAICSDTK